MELFKIADGRVFFYQWDLDRKILVADPAIEEVHFCNGTSDCSLVVKVEDGAANVPNVLLQTANNIRIFAVQENRTCAESVFMVKPRTKPEDYVYTETEIKRYEDLEKQIEEVKRSIPSVPVKSVNGKTGEVLLSAADVGALPKDTPIPAPYSLPTASADVKGGVKIGNGLRMDGDALNVLETLFDDEPIAEVTASTDVRNIIITEDKYGNPLELKALAVEVTTAPTLENKAGYIYCGQSLGDGALGTQFSPLGSTAGRLAKMYIHPLFGRWLYHPLGCVGLNGAVTSISMEPKRNLRQSIKDMPCVKHVTIYFQDAANNYLPAGTNVKVWGITA